MKHDVALAVAKALVEHLRPGFVRVEIAGSIRRNKPEVKDIEIVAVPDLSPLPRPVAVFGQPIPKWHKTILDRMLAEMVEAGSIRMEKNGERYKKFWLKYAGISVDLFLVLPPATWGVQLAIRTGPADFSHWCVSRARRGGAMPNGYRVQDGAVWEGEREEKDLSASVRVGFEEERDFLEFLGLGWLEPGERRARWKMV